VQLYCDAVVAVLLKRGYMQKAFERSVIRRSATSTTSRKTYERYNVSAVLCVVTLYCNRLQVTAVHSDCTHDGRGGTARNIFSGTILVYLVLVAL
jgi:hypothetical protein